LFTWIATSPARFAWAQRAAGFFSRLLSPRSHWLRLPAITGWGYSKDFPFPASQPFRDRWKKIQVAAPMEKAQKGWVPPTVEKVAAQDMPFMSPLERFEQELIALGGQAIRCDEEQVAERVLEILRQRGISAIQSWEAPWLPDGLLEKLRQAGIQVQHTPDPVLRLGLTGASAAIAESGSLLLCEQPGRPLTASLLPEVHVAVIHSRDIKENLPQVLALQEVRETPAAVLISGPSRTADIEMTLTIGVHGPGEVIVLCLA
jgi:L-lactate dehydrogenase complex protein LldG